MEGKMRVVEELVAKQGEKMVEVRVRFWTNGIAKGKGLIIPKHCQTSGEILIQKNKVHGIKPANSIHFHTLMELPVKVEQVLIKNGIKLHISEKMGQYIRGSKYLKS